MEERFSSWDVLLTDLDSDPDLILQVERGHFGKTEVVIYTSTGSKPVEGQTFEWDRTTGGLDSYEIVIPSDLLLDPSL